MGMILGEVIIQALAHQNVPHSVQLGLHASTLEFGPLTGVRCTQKLLVNWLQLAKMGYSI